MTRSAAALCLSALFAASLAGCRLVDVQDTQSIDHELFLRGFTGLEGQSFAGAVDESFAPTNPFPGEPLTMHVLEADGNSARIAFHVGTDHSRTWVLTRPRPDRLHLRHDHRHEDGTPHEITDYGGYAAPGGSARRQSFPADRHTARLIPEASTNIWTLELSNNQFIYALTRDDQPRFRAIFDLSSPQ